MQPKAKSLTEAWGEWAVPGEIIQIQGDNVLFRPGVSTRPFWLYLAEGSPHPEAVGVANFIIQAAIFNCQRLFPRRGEEVKVPDLSYHSDELERARGRLLRVGEVDGSFVLDLGFPVVVDPLEQCPELGRAQEGDILEAELIPPTRAYLV